MYPLKDTKILHWASILFLFIAHKYSQVLKQKVILIGEIPDNTMLDSCSEFCTDDQGLCLHLEEQSQLYSRKWSVAVQHCIRGQKCLLLHHTCEFEYRLAPPTSIPVTPMQSITFHHRKSNKVKQKLHISHFHAVQPLKKIKRILNQNQSDAFSHVPSLLLCSLETLKLDSSCCKVIFVFHASFAYLPFVSQSIFFVNYIQLICHKNKSKIILARPSPQKFISVYEGEPEKGLSLARLFPKRYFLKENIILFSSVQKHK